MEKVALETVVDYDAVDELDFVSEEEAAALADKFVVGWGEGLESDPKMVYINTSDTNASYATNGPTQLITGPDCTCSSSMCSSCGCCQG